MKLTKHNKGTIFALALLFSGVSAGIVCTMAGQLICEGALDWRMKPFYRRLLTRSVSVIPAIIIAASEGQTGLAAALNGCNVVLSVALIFLTFPLIWYTSCKKYMRVKVDDREVGFFFSSCSPVSFPVPFTFSCSENGVLDAKLRQIDSTRRCRRNYEL